jgi:hypothetical protein
MTDDPQKTNLLAVLGSIRTYREQLPGLTADTIRDARTAGITWEAIAEAVGMTPAGCRKLLQRVK